MIGSGECWDSAAGDCHWSTAGGWQTAPAPAASHCTYREHQVSGSLVYGSRKPTPPHRHQDQTGRRRQQGLAAQVGWVDVCGWRHPPPTACGVLQSWLPEAGCRGCGFPGNGLSGAGTGLWSVTCDWDDDLVFADLLLSLTASASAEELRGTTMLLEVSEKWFGIVISWSSVRFSGNQVNSSSWKIS